VREGDIVKSKKVRELEGISANGESEREERVKEERMRDKERGKI